MNLLTTSPKVKKNFIQPFGCLVVISPEDTIRGISENFGSLAQLDDIVALLGTSFSDLVKSCFAQDAKKIMLTIDKIQLTESSRQLMVQVVRDTSYYLSVYRSKGLVYLEWEPQKAKSISAREMNDIGFLFEKTPRYIWESLCRSIQHLINYDHVFVFDMSEDGSGQVVAECSRDDQYHLSGTRFSSSFMTPEIIDFYASRSHRFSANLFTAQQQFFSLGEDIVLNQIPYVAFPSIPAAYFNQIGATSVLTYSIWVDGDFWGLVIAYNKKVKDIDLQKRKLCLFIVQNAVGKYETLCKENLLRLRDQIKVAQLSLKEKLLFARSINCALAQSVAVLCDIPGADGLVLYHQGDLYPYGRCPEEEQISGIVDIVKSQPKRPLFKDNNFSLRHGEGFDDKLPFAGLMVLWIGQCEDHLILWFRKETVQSVKQIGGVNQGVEENGGEVKSAILYEIWDETLLETALPWSEDDWSFAIDLDRIINDAIIAKAREYENSNEKLVSLNNELEMLTYTLSHDLRNPLSIVKMGVQFLEANKELPAEKQKKWRKSILEGVEHIEGMVNQLLHLGNTHQYSYAKEPVPMVSLIRKLCRESKILHNSPKCKIVVDNVLPVWGEKSVLYQIFLNIIGNAVKYSGHKASPEVVISSREEEGFIVYTVKDNGIGIPPDQLAGIFDLFQRASNAGDFQGSGLGLCLVKRIISKLGGKIEVYSDASTGTVFQLYFPTVAAFSESFSTNTP